MTHPAPVTALLLLVGCPALDGRDVDELSDQDGDGVPSIAYGGRDCDDRDPAVNPDAGEACDGIDNDCDGLLNEADPDTVGIDWYRDADGDGAGDQAAAVRTCLHLGELGAAWVHVGPDGFDCDDRDPDQHPGQQWRVDGDGDGFPSGAGAPRVQCARPEDFVPIVLRPSGEEDERAWDCRDFDATVFPGAVEICNGTDDDCDGDVDTGDSLLAFVVYSDADEDGFGDPATAVETCTPTAEQVALGGDCDDDDDTVSPIAREVPYDGIDQDCADRDLVDVDGDGVVAVEAGGEDCDDHAAWVFPGAPEVCDGAPNGCQDASSWSSTSETGAWFVELTADPTSPDPRRYTDLAPILSMNGTFITPATGVVWLCDDQRWTGLLSASEPLRITSPEGQRAQFGREAAPGTLISGDLEVLGIDLVVELQAFGGVRLEDVSLQGTLNHGLGGFAATDTTFAPNPGGGALYSVGGTLSLDGPLTFQGVTATNFPIRIDAARRTVDIVDSTFTDSAQAFALDVSRPDQVTLTTDTFRDVVGAIRVTTSGTLGATDVQFVRAGTNVSWLGQPYALGDGTFDFSCAGRVCTTP